MLAALAVASLLVAPAVGVRVPILDFWTAEKAPPKIVEDFESLAEGAPAGETERLIAAALVPIVTDASTAALRSLYPDAPALGESAPPAPLAAQ